MAQYYMLNKPRGLLTARRDARCETVMRCFPEALQQTLHPVGRLDKDTEGLLLFTDDGMLDVRLLRPERHVEKEYEYRAFGHLDEAALRQLETGVVLAEASRSRARHGPRCSRTPPSARAKRTCRSGSGRNI
ncbi:MAG: pseudouridine synthase [Oscillospiraceae bacterium]